MMIYYCVFYINTELMRNYTVWLQERLSFAIGPVFHPITSKDLSYLDQYISDRFKKMYLGGLVNPRKHIDSFITSKRNGLARVFKRIYQKRYGIIGIIYVVQRKSYNKR